MVTRTHKTTKINGTIKEEGHSELTTGGWIIVIIIGLVILGALVGG